MNASIREGRYLVLKNSDMQAAGLSDLELGQLDAIRRKVEQYRESSGKSQLHCVVVEMDWPEFEPTWQAIESRIAAQK